MSGQPPRRQSRGGGEGAPPPPARPPATASTGRSQLATTTPILSVESADNNTAKSSNTPLVSPNLPPASSNVFRVPESPRSTATDPHKAAKIAIPRLKRSVDDAVGDGSTRSGGRHRVNHACEPCRHRKTKCSGERPTCRHCQDFKIACYYADGKRDRVKKQFGTMTEKVADYERLLKDLATRVSDADAQLIKASLDKEAYDYDTIDAMTIPSIEEKPEESESGAESEASGGAGSTGALDRTDEDFTREGAKRTGFMGKNSEITWLQRTSQENRFGDDPPEDGPELPSGKRKSEDNSVPAAEADEGLAVSDVSYHLDDLSIDTYDHVDAWEFPTQDTAQHLLHAFMTRVHPTFPIVGKINLVAQFNKVFVTKQVQTPPQKWSAIVNLIFAIAAKYSHLVRAEWRGDERDHIIYFTRARLLGISASTLLEHPDLQNIQILGLMSLYLLCTSQINRAWTLAGIAIRQATALGMNMRNNSTKLSNPLKEIRYRLWWALYNLEQRLCSMTGRVNCILDAHCTTPLPAPIEEDRFDSDEGTSLLSKERQQGDRAPFSNSHSPSHASQSSSASRSRSQTKATESRSPSTFNATGNMEWAKDSSPNASLYFLHLVQLTRLTQNIFHQLYNPSAISGTWSDIQDTMAELSEQLENWIRKLPSIFDFRRNQRDRDFYEYRLSLGFFYYSTKMTIHRPCLCRLDRKIPNQSTRSHNFNRHAATVCIDAARDMMRLVPQEPNPVGLISSGPWWNILHYLVQSASVLIIEMSFRAHHMPEEAEDILEVSKKVVHWLHALGEDNVSARRAWVLCDRLLRQAASKIGRDTSDMPTQPPGRSSVSSTSGDTSMRDVNKAVPDGMNYSTSADMYSTVGMQNNFAFGNMDHLIHYDQYFPYDQHMNQNMPYSQPASSGMEFLNPNYHDEQNQATGHSSGQGMSPSEGQTGSDPAGGPMQQPHRTRYN